MHEWYHAVCVRVCVETAGLSNRGCAWEEMGGGTDRKLRARGDLEGINITSSWPPTRHVDFYRPWNKGQCRMYPVSQRQGDAWIPINRIASNALDIARERDLGVGLQFQIHPFCALRFSHQQRLVHSA